MKTLSASHVSTLVEREPLGYAVVHLHAPVGKQVDGLRARQDDADARFPG